MLSWDSGEWRQTALEHSCHSCQSSRGSPCAEWGFLGYLGQNTCNGITGLGTDSDPVLCALKVQRDVLGAILVGDRVVCSELLNGLSGGPRSALQHDDVVEGGVLETVASEFDGDHGSRLVEDGKEGEGDQLRRNAVGVNLQVHRAREWRG